MRLLIKQIHLLIPFLTVLLFVMPLSAQDIDDKHIQELVQKEVERLITSDGALDAAIEKGIENFILKQRYAAERNKNLRQQEQAKNLRPVNADRDHIFGNPDAPITLLEYSDFECQFCKRFHPTVVKLLEENKDQVRWVYRHFPLDFHNPGAQKQAEASECVANLSGNDAFWKYTDLIYQRTKSNGKGFPLENLRPLAEEIGVDGDAFVQCLDSGKMTARVKEDIENGMEIGVSGTPAGFITNREGEVRVFAGAIPLDQLQILVDGFAQ